MAFQVERFYEDFQVEIAPPGHKHTRQGWIQTECPFCTHNPGYHLGYSFDDDFFCCWQCGFKPHLVVVKELANVNERLAKALLSKYRGSVHRRRLKARKTQFASKCSLPYGCVPTLLKAHRDYLSKRRFMPNKIFKEWELMCTGNLGPYNFRLIAPIFVDGELVSFQGRDITDKSPLKYKACAMDNEVIHHKHIVYGADYVEGDSVIVVEGITDAWNVGRGFAVATFGVKYTTAQVRFIASRFKKVFIAFDKEKEAQSQAKKLGSALSGLGVEAYVYNIDSSDPGSMNTVEVRDMLYECGFI